MICPSSAYTTAVHASQTRNGLRTNVYVYRHISCRCSAGSFVPYRRCKTSGPLLVGGDGWLTKHSRPPTTSSTTVRSDKCRPFSRMYAAPCSTTDAPSQGVTHETRKTSCSTVVDTHTSKNRSPERAVRVYVSPLSTHNASSTTSAPQNGISGTCVLTPRQMIC